jgi:hypothetical protein
VDGLFTCHVMDWRKIISEMKTPTSSVWLDQMGEDVGETRDFPSKLRVKLEIERICIVDGPVYGFRSIFIY